ncbi:MAG: TIR domain-containing protein, partial [Anaerolineae bacterium]|nr:TIR domain-containing protein [Anaerolineae bacterium]
MKNTAKYFISYARDDGEAYAKELRQKLIAEFGEDSLWRDREGIHADDQAGWWKQITDALDQVEFMLLLATPKAMQSKVVRKEWRYARSKGVTVCPILVPDNHPPFEKLPFGLSQKHFYDLNH